MSVLFLAVIASSRCTQWLKCDRTQGNGNGNAIWRRNVGLLYNRHHTLARLCESVLKATKQVKGKGQNSTPRHAKTPWPILSKIGVGDNVVDVTGHAKFYHVPFRGFCSPYMWFSLPYGVVLTLFWGFLQLATAYTPKRIFLRKIR